MLSVFFLFFCLAVGPADDSDTWVHLRETADHTWNQGEDLVVANPFGSIRVRGWDRSTVNIIANIQKRRANPAEAAITATRQDGRLILEATFPGESRPEWEKKPRRIDLTLLIPEKANLFTSARNDLIEIKGFGGNLEAENELGDVWVKTHGAVRIKSRQGKVTVLMMNPGPDEESTIETVHGTTTVYFPETARADVTVRTSGKLTTDYSADIETKLGEREKRATIRVGKGGHKMTITSHQGDIELLRRF